MAKKLAKVFHAELFGERDEKYKSLEENDISSVKWEELKPVEPYYFFVPKDFAAEEEYKKGFGIDELFGNYNTGIQTKNDKLAITFNEAEVRNNVEKFKELSVDELRMVFSERGESSGWNFENAKKDLVNNEVTFCKILYRPFDIRHTVYTGKSSGFVGRPRDKTMKHMIAGENLGLITLRLNGENKEFVILATKNIIEKGSLPRGNYSLFPLYIYNPDGTKTPNLDQKITEKIIKTLDQKSTPEQILDYIYAILHSPSYRQKYKEFLKIDFPRVPYPTDQKTFNKLTELGKELRELHLLESPKVNNLITTFPESGTNTVDKKYPKFVSSVKTSINRVSTGKIEINETQYFGNVPEVAWNFYIGGYQPAQKWLKDRKEKELTTEDIEHYQKIIVALTETDRIMKEIDEIVKF